MAGFPARRSPKEIAAAETEFFERLWYYRSVTGSGRPAQMLAEIAAKEREVEAKYKDLDVSDLYELGVISGKLSALRWVLGDEWDVLDT